MTRKAEPYCPYCKTYASDMPELDKLWAESPEHLARADEETRQLERISYALADGTYQPTTGNFACDKCYIQFGASRRALLRVGGK